MLIPASSLLLFFTALILLVLRAATVNIRASWLTGIGGSLLALVSVLFWLPPMPFDFSLSVWQPNEVFSHPILFRADSFSFPLALSIAALTLSILLTAAARMPMTNSITWAGALLLGGLGLLAVTAGNPLTLLLVWSALDLIELLVMLRSVDHPSLNEKVAIAFGTRVLGSGLLLWANTVSLAYVRAFDFQTISPAAGLYLIAAAGLRLGVLPLHLPYAGETNTRRGLGTSFRLVSAASSVVLLAHVPAQSLTSSFTPVLLALTAVAALYSGWMWLRAPDELSGRPYWVIGLASLAVISALGGNSLGVISWGSALILTGGSLFLSSVQQVWLNRALLVGAWSLSALPFSLTGAAWLGSFGWAAPFAIVAQSFLAAGFIRHALRPAGKDSLDEQPMWMRTMYLSGIVILILAQIFLVLFGWEGALQIGAWTYALAASLLAALLIWATPRLHVLNPPRAHWIGSTAARVNSIYQGLWSVYRFFERLAQTITSTLEGESGMMWTLLFIALFIAYLMQGVR